MYCGKCGRDDIEPIETIMKQDGSTVVIIYAGVCPTCGEARGVREIFHFCDWDELSEEEAKKVLDNAK